MEGIFMSRIDQRTYQLCQDCLCGRLTITDSQESRQDGNGRN
jgi:hypothetical protein